MTNGRARLLALTAYPLAPFLWLQGRQLRRNLPHLPEAAGPRQGSIQGDGHPVTLVVMGESTAAGVGVATQAEGLAGLLATALARETGRTIFWHVVAASGLNLRQMRRQLVPAVARLQPDAILLAAGVNDLLRLQTAAGYGRQLERLVLQLQKKLMGVVPLLVSPVPDVSHFPALPSPLREILGARSHFLQQASGRMCRTMEAVVQLPRLPEAAYAAELFAADGFHPGPNGYRLWAELAARELRTLF